MKCPHCPDVTLLMTERQGIEIQCCPQCRGIRLDRGELDRLLEVASGAASPLLASKHRPYTADRSHRRDFDDSDHHVGSHESHRHEKSWLSDIFG